MDLQLNAPATCCCISGQICSVSFTCCYIEKLQINFYLIQSQYSDTGSTSPSADPRTPGTWQGSHWSASLCITGMTRPGKIPTKHSVGNTSLKPVLFEKLYQGPQSNPRLIVRYSAAEVNENVYRLIGCYVMIN